MIENAELLEFFEQEYRRVRGSRRDIRPADRLSEDLGVDSPLASELLIALEDRYGLRLLHDPRIWQAATVEEMLDTVHLLEVEQQARAAAS